MSGPFTVILCEGYHDRAFLAGALVERLGWREPGLTDTGQRKPVQDRWGRIQGGDFGFTHPDGASLRLRPAHGHDRIAPAFELIALGLNTKPVDRLILNYDGDKGGNGEDHVARVHQSVERTLAGANWSPEQVAPGVWSVREPALEVRAMVWSVAAPTGAGVPEAQCLERVICAAIADVYPHRVAAVAAWLSDLPDALPKAHTWSVMAKWYAEHGCDDFFRDLWRDPALADALIVNLGPAWAHLEACAR